MRIDAYIKAEKFVLPIKHEELKKQVQEQVLRKMTLKPSTIEKIHPVIKIDRNDNLIVAKQKTNIFLLNFLLSVAEKKSIELEEELLCNNESIITKLREMTKLELSSTFEKLETEITNFLQGKTNTPQETESEKEEISKKEVSSTSNKDVQFNMSWVKQTHIKIQEQAKRKEGGTE